MTLNIHYDIIDKLNSLLDNNKVPNIIFHGPSGSGKRTIVDNFLKNIFHDVPNVREYIMTENCAHSKGIKFIREDLKFFAKTNIKDINRFKIILLLNADKLTTDAQSALRRCIELFSHTTRFFLIVENKNHLLKPILSRFCEIYIPSPIIDCKIINLHKYLITKTFNDNSEKVADQKLRTMLLPKHLNSNKNILLLSKRLYEKGYNAYDIMNYLENKKMNKLDKYKLLLTFTNIKSEIRDEKLLMSIFLYFIFLRFDIDLENITFM